MKLLVCDVEGTVFAPYYIEGAEHASYIWTRIADELGVRAKKAELETQKKWRRGAYGQADTGAAYINWVRASIRIHRAHGLSSALFNKIILEAPYLAGIKEFYAALDRTSYIPVLISGGFQNLNLKACRDLGIERENSFASCEYFFKEDGEIDWKLTFVNSCNFYGKEEIVNVLLRKYGLGSKDWIFIGDGKNDRSIARLAPLSIGINPEKGLKELVDFSFLDFHELMACKRLLARTGLLAQARADIKRPVPQEPGSQLHLDTKKIDDELSFYLDRQLAGLELKKLEEQAIKRIRQKCSNSHALRNIKMKLTGAAKLLLAGQTAYYMFAQLLRKKFIASSLLQSFCNATEIIIYTAFVLMSDDDELGEFIDLAARPGSYWSIYDCIQSFDNRALVDILEDYRRIRNLAAHLYHVISIDAALSFIIRTYENIQRVVLLINPMVREKK